MGLIGNKPHAIFFLFSQKMPELTLALKLIAIKYPIGLKVFFFFTGPLVTGGVSEVLLGQNSSANHVIVTLSAICVIASGLIGVYLTGDQILHLILGNDCAIREFYQLIMLFEAIKKAGFSDNFSLEWAGFVVATYKIPPELLTAEYITCIICTPQFIFKQFYI